MKTAKEETLEHIATVKGLLNKIKCELSRRAILHDRSKLQEPEASTFERLTPLLRNTTYGSPEYEALRAELGEALTHHYANNPHHPEHWPNGIKDMSLVDLIEMLCDWKAATLRHSDGDINRSIEINQKRFEYSDELKQILLNTLKVLDGVTLIEIPYDNRLTDIKVADVKTETYFCSCMGPNHTVQCDGKGAPIEFDCSEPEQMVHITYEDNNGKKYIAHCKIEKLTWEELND